MPTKLNMVRDISGYNTFGRPFPLDGFQIILLAGTAQSFTVPSSATDWLAVFDYTNSGADIWVANNATATVPPGNTFSLTTSLLNPNAMQVKAADVISCITGNASAQVGVALYQIIIGRG